MSETTTTHHRPTKAKTIQDWTALIGALGALALAVKGQIAPSEPEGEKARQATEASYEALRSAIVDSGKQLERLTAYVEGLQEHSKDLENRLRAIEHEFAANGWEEHSPTPSASVVVVGGAGGGGESAGHGTVSVSNVAGEGARIGAKATETSGMKPWAQAPLPRDLKALIPSGAINGKGL